MDMTWPLFLLIAATSGGAVTLGLLAMYLYGTLVPVTLPRASIFSDTEARPVFVFDGHVLLDASPAGRSILTRAIGTAAPWEGLMGFLAPRFPDLVCQIDSMEPGARLTLHSPVKDVNPLVLHVERPGGLLRLTLSDSDSEPESGFDTVSDAAINDELVRMRQVVSLLPYPVWREDADHRITWANRAYMDLLCRQTEQQISWPLPALFPPLPSGEQSFRAPFVTDRKTEWYDIRQDREDDSNMLCFAMPADAAVSAETSLKEFMQTLTKTFAHLPIGLAVFDRQRQLAIFNPALGDLTTLRADFLTSKPTLFAFLDRMREAGMIPEPKDYRSWRRQMAEIEQAASAGLFQETWNLPGSRTYRITGRPHPNGAMALIFEDITTEMSRARMFRANIELAQSALDSVDLAMAVFSETGVLVMSNRAYSDLWNHDPSEVLGAGDIAGMAAHWQSRSAPSDCWDRIENTILTTGDRSEWDTEVRLLDGRLLTCRVKPLKGGATAITFRPADGPARVRRTDPPRRQTA